MSLIIDFCAIIPRKTAYKLPKFPDNTTTLTYRPSQAQTNSSSTRIFLPESAKDLRIPLLHLNVLWPNLI